MPECPACEGKGYYLEKEGRWTVSRACKSCNGTGGFILKKPPRRGRPHSAEKTRTTVMEPCTICEPPGSGKMNLYGYGIPDKVKWGTGRRENCSACDGSGETLVTYIERTVF